MRWVPYSWTLLTLCFLIDWKLVQMHLLFLSFRSRKTRKTWVISPMSSAWFSFWNVSSIPDEDDAIISNSRFLSKFPFYVHVSLGRCVILGLAALCQGWIYKFFSTWSLDGAVNRFELVIRVQWLMKLALFMYLILHPAYTDSRFSSALRKSKMFL